MSPRVTLCYSVLPCVTPRYPIVTLCYSVLPCVPLCSPVLLCVTLCNLVCPCVTTLCHPVFPSVTLCYVVFPCVTLCFPVLFCVPLWYTAFACVTLYYPVLFCVPLGYLVLPCVNLIVCDRQLKYYSQTMVSGHRKYFVKDDCLQRFGVKYYCKSLSRIAVTLHSTLNFTLGIKTQITPNKY